MPEFYIVPPRLIVGSFDRANVVTSINNIKGDLTFTADPNTGITLKISGNNFEYGAIPGFYVKRSGDTFLGNLDFTPTGSNYGLAIAQLASNPGTGRTGGLYFNTTEGEIRYYYGATGWTSISTAGGISVGFADGRYLKLDASNDPMQGDLDMSTYFFRVGNKATQSIAGQAGQIYWNTDSYRLEVYNDNTLAWEPIGIGAGGGSATTAKNIETTLTDEDSSHYLIFSKNYGTSGVALSSTSGLRLNPSSDSIIQGQWRASAIATTYGGTGLTTYNQGDILVGTGASILTSLSKGPNKYVLSSNTIFPNGIGWTTVTGVAITSLTPSYAINADLWWNNEDGSLSIYYQDENTSQWVEIVNAFVSAGTADTVVELGQQYQVGIYNATGNKIVGSDTFTNNTSTSIVNINHSTASNSTLTGALVIKGGLGLSGSASIGQTLYFFNTNDSNYIGFKSNSATASTVYILPSSTPVGTANSVLQSTPSGTLSWVPMTATGGGGAGVVDNGNIYEIPYYYSSGTSITGSQYFHNVGTGITVLFGTSSSSTQTGALVIRGGLGVTGNAFIGGTVTGELFVGNYIGTAATATNFYGTLIGTATTATNVNVASSGNTNTNHFLLFSRFSSGTGLAVSSAIGLSYNPSTGVLIGNTFQGNFEGFLVGLANTATYAHQSGYAITAGSATTSNSFSVNSTNANVSHSLLFTPATSNSTGAGLSIDSTLVYNASTDRLFTSGLSVTSVTGSTSATTGALIVSGGLGVSGQLTAIKASLGFTNNTTTPILSFVGTGVTSPINISANSDSSLSFDGYAGQLFGLDNNLTEGEIFSVNDVSGLAIISASAGHTILLNQFEGYTKIGLGKYNATGTTSGSLVVIGGAGITGNAFIGGTVTAPLFVGNYIGTAATATNFYGTLNGTATTSTNVHVASAGNTNTNHFLLFSRFSSGTGLAVSSAIGLSYNPSTGVLIGNTFQGNFEGFLVGLANTASYAHQSGYAITSGSGTVKTGTQYELGWYSQTGTAITGSGSGLTWNNGLFTIANNQYQSTALVVAIDGDTNSGVILQPYSDPGAFESRFAPMLEFQNRVYDSGVKYARTRFKTDQTGFYTSDFTLQASYDSGTPNWKTILDVNWSQYGIDLNDASSNVRFPDSFLTISTRSPSGVWVTSPGPAISLESYNSATGLTQFYHSPSIVFYPSIWPINLSGYAEIQYQVFSTAANDSAMVLDVNGKIIHQSYASGSFKLKQPISSTGVTTGALVVDGGVGISGNAFIGGTVNLINNTASIGKSSGALRVSGGVGIGGSIYTGGNINIESGNFIRLYEPGNTNYAAFKYTGATQKTYILPVDTPATGTSVLSSDTSGNMSWVVMSASGGAGNVDQGKIYAVPYYPSAGTLVTGSLNFFDVGTGVSITYSAASISTNTGALVVTGGVGVGGSLYVGGTASSISGLKINSSVITSGSWAGSTITMSYGGTGHTSNTKGDILVGTGQSWYKLAYSGNANDVLTVDSTQETGLKWASIPPASATSVSVKPANEAGARYITFVDQSTGSGLYLSTDTSLSYDASTNILTIGSLAANGVTVGLAQNTISTATGDLTLSSATGNVNIPGNLVVTGSTVSIGSSITTVLDPIFVLGAGVGGTNPTVDDNKDRGIEFRYFSGTAKTGFFGFDDSTGYFTFIPDGLNNNEVFSGTAGTAEFTTVIANLTGTATTAQNINVNSASNVNSDHFLFFGRFATGTGLAVSSATGLSYNPSSGIIFGNAFIGSSVTATNFYGNLSGSAATATNFYGTLNGTATTATNTNLVSDSVATANHPITFTPSTTTISGGAQSFNTNVYVIPSGNIVVATGFTGGLTGNVTGTLTGTATTAQNVNVASSGTASNTHYITFVSAATGSGLALSTCLTFNINPSTDTISVSGLAVTSRTNSTSSTSGALTVGGGLGVSGNASIGQSLLFFTPSGVNYIAFRAPAATGNTTYTLPLSAPASTGSSVLSSDVFGNLSWIAMTASGGGAGTVYTGVAPRMAYYQTSGAAVTDTYGINYLNTGTASTFTIFGGASLGSTVFVVSAIGSTIVRVGIGISTPSYELEVVGEISATNKSFVIDHPTKPGMKLRYGSLEGPENGVYVRGVLNNSNVIETPDYWRGLVDSSTFTVNLTPIGNYQFLYVEKVDDYKVYVGCAGTFINCYYSVWAERKDVPKLKVEY